MQFGIGFILFVLTLPVLTNVLLKDLLGLPGWLVFSLTAAAIVSLIAAFRRQLTHAEIPPSDL